MLQFGGKTVAIVAALLVSSASVAGAQSDAPMAESTEIDALQQEARTFFEAGRLAMGRGRYEAALQAFQSAYEVVSHPDLLYNIGVAHDRLRNDQEALDAFRRYLEESPQAPNREAVAARIVVLERAVARQATPEPAAEPEPTPPEPEPVAEPEPEPSPGPTPQPAEESGSAPAGAWVLVGVGAAGVVGAGLATAWALNRADAADECRSLSCTSLDPIETERDAAMGLSIAGGVVGLGALIGGAVWAASSGRDEDVACLPTGLGLGCFGAF